MNLRYYTTLTVRPEEIGSDYRGEIPVKPAKSTFASDRNPKEDASSPIRISETVYRQICDCLCQRIGTGNYYSGSIFLTVDGIECRLTAAIIVYRERKSYPEGAADEIKDLVPVWWEFHTHDGTRERLNDFQFTRLRNYI